MYEPKERNEETKRTEAVHNGKTVVGREDRRMEYQHNKNGKRNEI